MPPASSNAAAEERFAWSSAVALIVLIVAAVILSNLSNQQDLQQTPPSLIDEVSPLPPLFPLSPRDYVGYALAMAGLVIAAGGGIGGGGILVPVYTLVLQFPVKHAIPLTAMTVLGGALANNFANLSKRHPIQPNRSLIDWDVILMLEPTTIAGAILGALLHVYLPALLIVVLLLVLLLLTAHLTLTKAMKLYRKETEAQLLGATTRSCDDEETQRLVASVPQASAALSQAVVSYGAAAATSTIDDDPSTRRDSKIMRFVAQENYLDALKLTALFIIVTAINLFKGGLHNNKTSSHASAVSPASPVVSLPICGTTCFWISNVAILLVVTLFVVWTRRELLQRIKQGGPAISDIAWDEYNSVRYPVYAIVAGIVAGLFGIGGGIVKGPLMLALGVHPQVASATSACMIFFTSCTAAFSFMIFGLLTLDYAIAFLLIGFVSTCVGQSVLSLLMRRHQRHSYIAFSIGIVIALSAVCMTAESFLAYEAERAVKKL
ncbi:hypothetical protein MPSEU_000585600 [Mayamaea pseudoterrestris]|nr:hypothetical protein MPSEU_000585600 [Mayamaea pseudoterrestris]